MRCRTTSGMCENETLSLRCSARTVVAMKGLCSRFNEASSTDSSLYRITELFPTVGESIEIGEYVII